MNGYRDINNDLITIPHNTLSYLQYIFSTNSILTDKAISSLPESQQLGYLKGANAVLSVLENIHNGG